jgi:hypothetical protein
MKNQEIKYRGMIKRGSEISSHGVYNKRTHMDQTIARRIKFFDQGSNEDVLQ